MQTDTNQTAAIATWIDRALPAAVRENLDRWPTLALVGRILTVMALFVVINVVLQKACHLPTASYEAPVLFLELIDRLGTLRVSVLLAGVWMLYRFGALRAHWEAFDHGTELRWFVFVLAVLMAWPFATLGYNYYFDQGYVFDRLLLLAALIGIWFRPAFVFLFLPLAFVIMYQLVEPALGGSILAHKEQVLRVLTLFAGFMLLHATTGNRRSSDYVFLAACLVAGAYWEAAVAKMQLGWITFGNLHLALFSSTAHGWLAGADPSAIERFSEVLQRIDWPMRLFVMGTEAGCLVFLWRRPLSLFLLVCVVIFHLGVFAIFGFFFWTWILLDLALLVLLARQGGILFPEIHTRAPFLLSVVLIGGVALWAKPPHLGWFDTGLSYTLRYTAVGESGKAYALSPRFFSPYSDVFTMISFPYAVTGHARLTGSYGVVKDKGLAERLSKTVRSDEVFALESELGVHTYNQAGAERLFAFIERYLRNWNARGAIREAWTWLIPPPQFWASVVGREYMGQERIRELRIVETTNLYGEGRLHTIRETDVATLYLHNGSDDPATQPARETGR